MSPSQETPVRASRSNVKTETKIRSCVLQQRLLPLDSLELSCASVEFTLKAHSLDCNGNDHRSEFHDYRHNLSNTCLHFQNCVNRRSDDRPPPTHLQPPLSLLPFAGGSDRFPAFPVTETPPWRCGTARLCNGRRGEDPFRTFFERVLRLLPGVSTPEAAVLVSAAKTSSRCFHCACRSVVFAAKSTEKPDVQESPSNQTIGANIDRLDCSRRFCGTCSPVVFLTTRVMTLLRVTYT